MRRHVEVFENPRWQWPSKRFWLSAPLVSWLIPAMTVFSRGDHMVACCSGPVLALWWQHADTVTLGDQSSIWRTLPTLLTLVHKIVPTLESDLRPPDDIPWDQAAVVYSDTNEWKSISEHWNKPRCCRKTKAAHASSFLTLPFIYLKV